MDASVSLGWVKSVMQTAHKAGIGTKRLMATAQIDEVALQQERWPIDYITRLWRAAETCTADLGFGLKVGQDVTLANINTVGFALPSAHTLGDAFGMLQKYQRLISDGGRFQLLAGDSRSWLVYHPRQGELAFSPHQIEAVLSAVVNLACRIMDRPLAPQRIQLSQSQLGPMAGYQIAFRCPVAFDQAFSGILMDNSVLSLALPQADHQLAKLHEQFLDKQLAALTAGNDLSTHLKHWISQALGPALPRRDQAARMLGISERTLARRLAKSGTSFTQLLDESRCEAACIAVTNNQQSLADIAHSLGFAESSPFYRAFHRWTGLPPARWRALQYSKNRKT